MPFEVSGAVFSSETMPDAARQQRNRSASVGPSHDRVLDFGLDVRRHGIGRSIVWEAHSSVLNLSIVENDSADRDAGGINCRIVLGATNDCFFRMARQVLGGAD